MKKATIGTALAVAAMLFVFASFARADSLYFQGFETNTNGWTVSGTGAITRTLSGAGALGLTAFDGSAYGEAFNQEGGYCCTTYGQGGYSFFEGNGSVPPPYPGSGFSQAISIYINVNTPPPTNANDAGFAVDMSPGTTLTTDPCYPAACADEQLFRLFYNGTSVNVVVPEEGGLSTPTVANLSTSGWYTFQITYQPGSGGTVVNSMNILNATGHQISSTLESLGTNSGALLNSDLAGPGYVWLPQWQDGFSNDLLGIDDVRADTLPTPEPPSGVLLLIGLIGLAAFWYRRAHCELSVQA